MTPLVPPLLLAIAIVFTGIIIYTIIDRLRFGRWIDRPSNLDDKTSKEEASK